MPHKTRPRMLFPSLWQSEKVASLSDRAFRLYIWMITQADDEGRSDWFPGRVASEPWLQKPISREQATAAMEENNNAGLVTLFSVNGKQFYQIHKWKDFQKIREDRCEKSTYPPPPQNAAKCGETRQNAASVSVSETVSVTETKAAAKCGVPYEEIISDLNEVCKKKYSHRGSGTQRLIQARWQEGYRLGDFKRVHRNMKAACADGTWGQDKDMTPYLRPETLYSNKFEGYLNWDQGRGGDRSSQMIQRIKERRAREH